MVDGADAVARAFEAHRLKGLPLAALDAARSERGESSVRELGHVIECNELKAALGDLLGDTLASRDLFPLIQLADPDGDGVVTLPRFREVVELRRSQLDEQRRQALQVAAYVALGGTKDRGGRIDSAALAAVTADFAGSGVAAAAMEGVVTHRLKALQSMAGCTLDEEDEAELRDTSRLEFDDLGAYAAALAASGCDDGDRDEGGAAGGAVDPATVLR